MTATRLACLACAPRASLGPSRLLSGGPNASVAGLGRHTLHTDGDHTTQRSIQGAAGSDYYVAPEVLKCGGEATNCPLTAAAEAIAGRHAAHKSATYYTSSCDVWSAGVAAYVMLTRKPPFESQKEDRAEATAEIRAKACRAPPAAWRDDIAR